MTITPPNVVLRGAVGEKISQIVTVVPGTKEPIRIIDTNALNQSDFQYSMSEIEKDGETAYQFLIENIKTSAGKYLHKVFIITNITEHNPVTFIVRGDIKP